MKKRVSTRKIIIIGILIAIDVVLTRMLAINTPIAKIGLGFTATVVCAILYGPWWTAFEAAASDFIGAVALPIGAYNPCFTITAALTGLLFGFCLRGENPKWTRALLTACINVLIISLCLNTFFIHYFYGVPLKIEFLATRLTQAGIMLPAQFIVIWLLTKNNTLKKTIRRISG